MKRAMITIPDELRDALEQYARRQEEPPELSSVVQMALREFLERREGLEERESLIAGFTILEERDDLGESDVSVNHDKYLAEVAYKDSFNEQ